MTSPLVAAPPWLLVVMVGLDEEVLVPPVPKPSPPWLLVVMVGLIEGLMVASLLAVPPVAAAKPPAPPVA